MATYAINYSGLRVKPSYESLVQTIANQPMIRYPNRMASLVRDSPYMTALQDLNQGEMAEEDEKRKEEEVKKTAVRQAASETGGTAALMEASSQTDMGPQSAEAAAQTNMGPQSAEAAAQTNMGPQSADASTATQISIGNKAVQVPERKKG